MVKGAGVWRRLGVPALPGNGSPGLNKAQAAQFRLGTSYYYDLGVAKDESQAAAWYQAAAFNGCDGGAFHLGWMYENGHAVAKDTAAAIFW